MSINCTVTPGQTYGARYTVDYLDLNKLGNPTVAVPDGGTLAFTLATVAAGTAGAPSLAFTADLDTGFYNPAPNVVGVAGQLGAADGTLAEPAITFATDLDTGLYRAAANRIGVSGALALADGTAAIPSLTFTTDPDTGFAAAGANSFAASCGGAAVATFSATGIDAVGLRVSGSPVSVVGPDMLFARFFSDMTTGNAAGEKCIDVVTATGSVTESGSAVTATVNGAYLLQTSAANDTAQRRTILQQVRVVDGTEVEIRFSTLTASTPAQRYELRIGIFGATDCAETSYFACFHYNDATAAQWMARAGRSDLTIEAVNTGVTATFTGTYQRFKMRRTASNLVFSINGTDVATLAQTLNGQTMYIATHVKKLIGAGSVSHGWCDWFVAASPITSRA